ncbi:MAG: hypothetical protein ACLTZB_04450 [Streptococcus salivarius]
MTTPLSGEWAEFDGKLYHFEKPISVSPESKVQLPLTLREKDGKPILTKGYREKGLIFNNNLKQQPFPKHFIFAKLFKTPEIIFWCFLCFLKLVKLPDKISFISTSNQNIP